MRSSVKRRKFWLIATSALAPLSLAVSEPALAQTFTFDSTGNNYTSGINVGGTNTQALEVILLPGVVVNTNPGVSPAAVNAQNVAGPFSCLPPTVCEPVTITANDAPITYNSAGIGSSAGLRIQSAGSATITSSGTIVVLNGPNNNFGIWSIVQGDNPPSAGAKATVIYTGPGITVTGGANSAVIQADNRSGNGDAFIDAAGNLTGIGPSGPVGFGIGGLFAVAEGNGNATVNYHSGTINVSGFFANGIFAAGTSANVTTDPGTNIIVTNTAGQQAKPGIAVDVGGGALTVHAASTIQMLGPAAVDPGFRNNGFGIRASSFDGGPILVDYTGPGITTQGGNGIGIAAASSGGGINVTSSGLITTSGVSAMGVLADAGTIIAGPGGGLINVAALGAISTQGAGAHGIWASSTTGTVQVNATNVSTTGQFSTAIKAIGGGDVTVNVGGPVMGGWQALPTGIGSSPFGLPVCRPPALF
jgi:hypothetical protein